MRVFVTGGTGLIGRRLVRRLIERGDRPVVLTRQADKARLNPALTGAEIVQGDPTAAGPWETAVSGCDAVVNLAGHNIFAERWSDEVKRKIRDSRVISTEHVIDAIRTAPSRPKVLVQGSAIGYYGFHGDEELTESSPPGDDFLARVCVDWEAAAQPAAALGLRLATIRIGVVLARGEGALGTMTPIFKLLPGTPIGSGGRLRPAKGRQWLSWIHLEDIVGILLLALDHPEAQGPINGTAPNPVRNAMFAKTLSETLWKPYTPWRFYIPIGLPDFLLGVLLGEVATLITTGQRVLPTKVQTLGYHFRFPFLSGALRDLFAQGSARTAPPERQPAAAGTSL